MQRTVHDRGFLTATLGVIFVLERAWPKDVAGLKRPSFVCFVQCGCAARRPALFVRSLDL